LNVQHTRGTPMEIYRDKNYNHDTMIIFVIYIYYIYIYICIYIYMYVCAYIDNTRMLRI
jgi:hypothetical protein